MKRFFFRVLFMSVFCFAWLVCIPAAAQESESVREDMLTDNGDPETAGNLVAAELGRD